VDEIILVESSTMRKQYCNENNTLILDKVGQLVTLPESGWATTENVAKFYEVPTNTIKDLASRNKVELITDGYKVISINDFREADSPSLKSKARSIAIFPRRAVLRIGMLLRDSSVAKLVRNYLLNTEAQPQQPTYSLPDYEVRVIRNSRNVSNGYFSASLCH